MAKKKNSPPRGSERFYLLRELNNGTGSFFGKRYIFFKDLNNYSYSSRIRGLVNDINKYFDTSNINIPNTLINSNQFQNFSNVMKNLGNFLQKLIENERKAEIKYANEMYRQIKQIDTKKLPQEIVDKLDKIEEYLNNINTGEFNYLDYINLINILKDNIKNYKEDLDNFNTQLIKEEKAIDNALKRNRKRNLKKQEGEERLIDSRELIDYLATFKNHTYQEFMRQLDKEINLHSLNNVKLNQRIVNLVRQLTFNPLIKEDLQQRNLDEYTITNAILTGALREETDITNVFKGIQKGTTFNVDYSTILSKEAKIRIMNLIEAKIVGPLVTDIVKIMVDRIEEEKNKVDPKERKSIEDLIKKETFIITKPDANASKEEKQQYKELVTIRDRIINGLNRYVKEKTNIKVKAGIISGLTRNLKLYFKKAFKNQMWQLIQDSILIDQKSSENKVYITEAATILQDIIRRWRNANIKVDGVTDILSVSSTAELNAIDNRVGTWLEQGLKGKISTSIGGVQIQRKPDIVEGMIPWTVKELENKLNSLSTKQEKMILKTLHSNLLNFENDLENILKQKIGNDTNIEVTITEFNQLYENTAEYYIKLKQQIASKHLSLEEQEKQLKLLQEFISRSQSQEISVKDYKYYNTNRGFEGGTLGSQDVSGTFVTGFNNIMKLYEKVGINPSKFNLNYDLMIEAGLNCGEDFFLNNNSPIIQNIKEFLIAGAAMMMFETGFANTEQFIKSRRAAYEGDLVGHNIVHFYNIQGKNIPASYVLQNIYENITAMQVDIISEANRMTSENVSSNLYIDNDMTYHCNADSKEIKKYKKTGSPWQTYSDMDRWEMASKQAVYTTEMKFMFLAGLEDLFDNLSKRFSEMFEPST